MTQNTIEFPPLDPNVWPCDVKKITGKNLAVLRQLRIRPTYNRVLAQITPRYGARIYDLRGAGFEIDTKELRDGTGSVLYTLVREPEYACSVA